MEKENKNTRYIVFNNTDGIPASCDCHGDGSMTKEEAEKFVKEFPLRYERQGYYRTNTWEKIRPEDVKLEIRPLIIRSRVKSKEKGRSR